MARYECCNPDCNETFDTVTARDKHEATCEVKKQKPKKKKS